MMRITLALFFVFASGLVWAGSPSAYRKPGTSYHSYMGRVATSPAQPGLAPYSSHDTPESSAVGWGSQLPAATSWPSYDIMLERFKRIRDHRWMKAPGQNDFLRRITWLYPDDGCFARAGLVMLNFAQWAVSLPNKVYVFGDLNVSTPNAPYGQVTWWYHVAPIVEVNKQKYVLDPSIEPAQPMRLEDWVGRMTRNPASLELAICGSGSYTPEDLCEKDSDGVESMAQSDEMMFLRSEWSRLLELNRNPNDELGDKPPWN